LQGNSRKILAFVGRAKKQKADLIVFPELAITGYPPEDLVLKPQFIADNKEALAAISRKSADMRAIVGFVDSTAKGLLTLPL